MGCYLVLTGHARCRCTCVVDPSCPMPVTSNLTCAQEHASSYLNSTYVPKLVGKKVPVVVLSHKRYGIWTAHASWKANLLPAAGVLQIPYQVEIVKSATGNDTIGAVICKRAEQINAAAVVLAKHNKGAIAEFFVGSVTNYCESHFCAVAGACPVPVMHALSSKALL